MLPSAFISLSDPCLPDFWIDTYTAAPGAITMAAAIVIFLIEFESTRYLAAVDRKIVADQIATSVPQGIVHKTELNSDRNGPATHSGHHHIVPPPVEGDVDTTTASIQKLGVIILEAGIIFHSVFIGLTLAISTGSDFVSLFVTIIFHRIFPLSKQRLI